MATQEKENTPQKRERPVSEEDLQAQKKKDIRRNVFSHEDMIQ
jgi:hypothetical protein